MPPSILPSSPASLTNLPPTSSWWLLLGTLTGLLLIGSVARPVAPHLPHALRSQPTTQSAPVASPQARSGRTFEQPATLAVRAAL